MIEPKTMVHKSDRITAEQINHLLHFDTVDQLINSLQACDGLAHSMGAPLGGEISQRVKSVLSLITECTRLRVGYSQCWREGGKATVDGSNGVASRLDVTKNTIFNWLKKLKLDTRSFAVPGVTLESLLKQSTAVMGLLGELSNLVGHDGFSPKSTALRLSDVYAKVLAAESITQIVSLSNRVRSLSLEAAFESEPDRRYAHYTQRSQDIVDSMRSSLVLSVASTAFAARVQEFAELQLVSNRTEKVLAGFLNRVKQDVRDSSTGQLRFDPQSILRDLSLTLRPLSLEFGLAVEKFLHAIGHGTVGEFQSGKQLQDWHLKASDGLYSQEAAAAQKLDEIENAASSLPDSGAQDVLFELLWEYCELVQDDHLAADGCISSAIQSAITELDRFLNWADDARAQMEDNNERFIARLNARLMHVYDRCKKRKSDYELMLKKLPVARQALEQYQI